LPITQLNKHLFNDKTQGHLRFPTKKKNLVFVGSLIYRQGHLEIIFILWVLFVLRVVAGSGLNVILCSWNFGIFQFL
jgi:hypothetical protein